MPLLQRPCWAKNGSGRFVPRGPHYSGGKGMRTEDHHLGSAGQDGPKGKEKQRYSSLVSSLTLGRTYHEKSGTRVGREA